MINHTYLRHACCQSPASEINVSVPDYSNDVTLARPRASVHNTVLGASDPSTKAHASRFQSSRGNMDRIESFEADHRSIDKQFGIFCHAMAEKEENDENDIEARKLVQAWSDIAYTDFLKKETSISISPTANELKNDPRYHGFFYTQRALVANPRVALSILNDHRNKLGLSQVNCDHPGLVSPELSDEHRGLVKQSRKNPQVNIKVGSVTQRSNKVKEKIKPRTLRHSPSATEKKKLARHVTHRPVPPESVQETEIWADIPDEVPQSGLGNGDTKPDTQAISKPGTETEGNNRFEIKQTLGIRSSERVATRQSLNLQTVVLSQTQPKTEQRPVREVESKKSKRKRVLVKGGLESEEGSSVAFVPEPATDKFEKDRDDSESEDILFKDYVPLRRIAETNAMDGTFSGSLSNGPRSLNWCNSYLTKYVRIPVWAKHTSNPCKGGVYTRGGTVYGYLLGRFPSPRDGWFHEGRLIISHGGGKNVMDEGESDPSKARHQLGDDQLESDKSVRALLTSYRMFRPIVILAEADYEPLQSFNLKQGYAAQASYYVLGHYAIVAAWAEHEEVMTQGSTHTRWKFAFQYIRGNQGPPWWLQPPGANIISPKPPGVERVTQASGQRRSFGSLVSGDRKHVSEVTTESFTGAPSIECNVCLTLSPHVYELGPICLNPDCSSFWKHNGLPVSQTDLGFNRDFLILRGLPEQLQKIPYTIVPEYPDWQHCKNGEPIFNRHYWAGACCHRCGRVSCRQKWQCWECLTCGLQREESRPQIYANSCLFGPMDCETQGGGIFSPHDMSSKSQVIRYHDGSSRLAIYYILPNDIGRIVHVLNNQNATHKADLLFQQYQQDASRMNMFQRHAIKTQHGVKGELYAQHYTHNAGAPYKYIAEAISTPFEDCPKSVVEAKDHIQYLCEPALGKTVEFNEVLSVAYAEGQEMNAFSFG
ncbi:hypothetical protein OPQ81_005582 [Rhizoctonia solani]|nr:hypothetical protein OPQ81_005582 [Rhizoctonia solani]